jgi:peptidyl-prolyl cis-trans isomerase B (cyclophilin B)
MKPIALFLAAVMLSLAAGAAVQEPGPGDAALPLLREFRSLFDSLQSAGGLREENLPAIRSFRQRLDTALAAHPGNLSLLGLDAQLSMWLGEDDRVDRAFRALVEASGGDRRFGAAWVGYFNTKPDQEERLDRIREDLIRLHPGDASFVVDWAAQLEQQARFGRALELLAPVDPVAFPRTAVIRARCLVALDRFEEAIAVLDAVPAETLEANAPLKADVAFLKAVFGEYPQRWVAEQEARSQDAARDDLPRAEIITAAGRFVVELFEDAAPNTVANFITLAETGFYDQTKVHLAVPGQRFDLGDPNSRTDAAATGPGGPGYTIEDEATLPSARSHFAGSLVMVKGREATDRAGSIFSLSLRPEPGRNGLATVFGRVIEGNDALRRVARGDVVESIRVLRKRDHAYEVRKIEAAGAAGTQPGSTPPGAAAPEAPQAPETPGFEPEGAGGGTAP